MAAGPSPHRRTNSAQLSEDRRLIYELRLEGHTFAGIDALTASPDGPTGGRRISKTRAVELVELEIAEREQPLAEALRAIECDRLDTYLVRLAPRIAEGEDKAINTAIRISERRARLLGLDSPQQVDATLTASTPQDQALNELLSQARARNEARVAAVEAQR